MYTFKKLSNFLFKINKLSGLVEAMCDLEFINHKNLKDFIEGALPQDAPGPSLPPLLKKSVCRPRKFQPKVAPKILDPDQYGSYNNLQPPGQDADHYGNRRYIPQFPAFPASPPEIDFTKVREGILKTNHPDSADIEFD